MSGIEQLTENIIQSERTQFKRLYTVGFHLCEKSRMDKSAETESVSYWNIKVFAMSTSRPMTGYQIREPPLKFFEQGRPFPRLLAISS